MQILIYGGTTVLDDNNALGRAEPDQVKPITGYTEIKSDSTGWAWHFTLTVLLEDSSTPIRGGSLIASSLGILVGIGLVDIGRVHSAVRSILLRVCHNDTRVVVTLLLQLTACRH